MPLFAEAHIPAGVATSFQEDVITIPASTPDSSHLLTTSMANTGPESHDSGNFADKSVSEHAGSRADSSNIPSSFLFSSSTPAYGGGYGMGAPGMAGGGYGGGYGAPPPQGGGMFGSSGGMFGGGMPPPGGPTIFLVPTRGVGSCSGNAAPNMIQLPAMYSMGTAVVTAVEVMKREVGKASNFL